MNYLKKDNNDIFSIYLRNFFNNLFINVIFSLINLNYYLRIVKILLDYVKDQKIVNF